MPVDVFLLTRLWVRINESSGLPSRDWFESRLPHFEKWCLPNVLAQHDKHFTWLLFVDAAIAEHPAIAKLQAYPGVEVIAVTGVCEASIVSDAVAFRARRNRVVTGRVDSDDALATDYIARVRDWAEHVEGQLPQVLNFPQGLQHSREAFLRYRHPSNPFIAMVDELSAVGELGTVFAAWHDRISDWAPISQGVTSHPMWIQVLHGSNAANQERGVATKPQLQPWFDLNQVSRKRPSARRYVETYSRAVKRLLVHGDARQRLLTSLRGGRR